MITTTSTISYERQAVPPIIPVVQGDSGRNVSFTLSDYTIPTGSTANFYIQKPSGAAIYNSATVVSPTNVLVELDAQCLAEYGENYGQIRVINDGEVVTSFDFILLVKPFRGIDATESTTEMNIFDQAVGQAIEEISSVLDDTLTQEGKAAEAKATGDAIKALPIQAGTGVQSARQGTNNTASGNYSFAEGWSTKATTPFAHAEGDSTVASGYYGSHAEGFMSEASGDTSHAEGSNTKATHKNQHVFGAFNEEDPSDAASSARGTYIEIVGNGTSNADRSNARTLDWDGNEVLAGKLTVGADPKEDMDVTTKQYVDGLIASLSEDADGFLVFEIGS